MMLSWDAHVCNHNTQAFTKILNQSILSSVCLSSSVLLRIVLMLKTSFILPEEEEELSF